MPVVKRLHGRGIRSGVVEAHGEVLFSHGAVVPRWTSQFTRAIKTGAEKRAPSNKRPRWSHYGDPLKKSFTATTKPDPARMMVHAAVGSRAHYSLFVDQGTKAHMAKILPPWKAKGLPLYEHTQWIPGTRKQRGEIPVDGQKAQNFFEYGLRFGFAKMRMVEGMSPESAVRSAVNQTTHSLPEFLGATPVDAAFKIQLEEWRQERTKAFRAKSRRRTSGARNARRAQARDAFSQRTKPTPAAKAKLTKVSPEMVQHIKNLKLAKMNAQKEKNRRAEEAAQKKATQDLIKKNQTRQLAAAKDAAGERYHLLIEKYGLSPEFREIWSSHDKNAHVIGYQVVANGTEWDFLA